MEESLRDRDFMQWLQIYRVVQERPTDRPARHTESLFREILRKDHGIVPLAVALTSRRVRVRYSQGEDKNEAIWEVDRWATDLLLEAIRRDPRYGAIFPDEVVAPGADLSSDFVLPETYDDKGDREAEFVSLQDVLEDRRGMSEKIENDAFDGVDRSMREVTIDVHEVDNLSDELSDHRERDEGAQDEEEDEEYDRRSDHDPETSADSSDEVHPDHASR